DGMRVDLVTGVQTCALPIFDGALASGYELVLISEESYTTFHPMLPEAVGASIFPEQVVAPIRQMLSRGRFIMGRVSAIDPAAKRSEERRVGKQDGSEEWVWW